MELQQIQRQTNWGDAVDGINSNNLSIGTEIEKLKHSANKNLGYFTSLSKLQEAYPQGKVGDVAYVGTSYPYKIYEWKDSAWTDTLTTGGSNVSFDGCVISETITDATEILDTL